MPKFKVFQIEILKKDYNNLITGHLAIKQIYYTFFYKYF